MHPYEMRSLMRERRHDRAFRVGFIVMAVIAALAMWWGTRAYQRAMA
jgi:diacylglycerol kinase